MLDNKGQPQYMWHTSRYGTPVQPEGNSDSDSTRSPSDDETSSDCLSCRSCDASMDILVFKVGIYIYNIHNKNIIYINIIYIYIYIYYIHIYKYIHISPAGDATHHASDAAPHAASGALSSPTYLGKGREERAPIKEDLGIAPPCATRRGVTVAYERAADGRRARRREPPCRRSTDGRGRTRGTRCARGTQP